MPAPLPLSMILCDTVVVDRATGKSTLIGTFSNINSREYPAMHPSLTVFAELTDGRGEIDITVKVCRSSPDEIEGNTIGEGTVTVTFPHPRAIARLLVELQNLVLPEPGEYRVMLKVKDLLLVERRMDALLVPKP